MSFPIKTLGDLCSFAGGGTPSRAVPEYYGGDIPWVTVKDFHSFQIAGAQERITEVGLRNSSARLVKANVVLLVSRVGLGKVAITTCQVAINQDVKALTVGPLLHPEYLLWFLVYKSPAIKAMGVGATVKGVTLSDIKRIQIPVPSLPEQRRVVDILSRAESIVRLRREAQKKAAELIPALFLDTFGDPATNPKRWAVKTLGDLVEEFRYGTSQKSGPTGLPVLRIPNVIGDRLEPADMKFVAVPEIEVSRLRLQDGDILFVRTNGNPDYVGRSAVFDSRVMKSAGFDGENSIYASYLIRARIDRAVIEPVFLQTYLSSLDGRKKLKERSRTSAGQFNINTAGLASIPVPVPAKDLQLEFVERYQSVVCLAAQQSTATTRAEATFNALLAQAFAPG